MTVDHVRSRWTFGDRFNIWFNDRFEVVPEILRPGCWARPCAGRLSRWPPSALSSWRASRRFRMLGLSFFPRTDAGQFVINLKAPTGTRLAVTESEVAKVEDLIRQVVSPEDLGHDRLQHRHDARVLRHLHHQLRRAHRVRAGQPEGGPQDRQLRVHGAASSSGSKPSCRN